MENRILQQLRQRDYTPQTASELHASLRLRRNESKQLEEILSRLERSGQIARIKQDRYALPIEADLVPGRIRINRQGTGFLQPDDPKLPVLRIPSDATATAMHGDHVLVRRDRVPRPAGQRGREEPTGRVVRVLETARTQIVGTLQSSRQFLYVIPDDPRIPQDIYVPQPRDVGRPARVGDKVVVDLREWKSRHTNPEGEIVEVLGPPDAEGVDMLSVIRQYQLSLHFPKDVLQEARSFGHEVRPDEIVARVDCRNHCVITIDPEDAKDFDDAICLERVDGGQWKLWVHIADVSHYIKAGSALDEEASRRGNSTYLVDRVIPMLPEALSNELCSLKPHVDRLTKCVEFLLSTDGRVLRTQFYPAVIRSQWRFNYREVLAILAGQQNLHHATPYREQSRVAASRTSGDRPISQTAATLGGSSSAGSASALPPVPRALVQMLHDAHAIAQKLRRARFKAGSLDLDFPETKIRLDDSGRIARIEKVENDISHQLIEDFMLLANEAVAGRLMALNRPAVYRIHEPPDEKRLQEYREEVLSHHIQCGNLSNRREVQALLAKLGTLPIGEALKIGFLKSLMRARYAVEPIGHYGLAKKKYTHFTSPIRRYADLLVHRALFPEGARGARPIPPLNHNLAQIADHISETERNSADAERDSRDVKLFAFLNKQLAGAPQPYPALVTDIRNFGFFVDVRGLGMSGLVPLSGLSDDFYQLDQRRAQLVGRRTRRIIKLGDHVVVQVAKVDTFKRQVDFKLVSGGKEVEKQMKPDGRSSGREKGERWQESKGTRTRRFPSKQRSSRQRRF